jgi:hypothetical protein
MLTDQELIDGLRAGLDRLSPPADLLDQIRLQAAQPANAQRRGPIRTRGRLGARLRRPVSALTIALPIVLALAVGAAALALLGHGSPTLAPRARPAAGRVILSGDGIGAIRFGASPQQLRRLIDPILGAPAAGNRSGLAECGVDGELLWPIVLNPRTGRLDRSEELLLTFDDHSRFVGYQYGGFDPPRTGHAQRLALRAVTLLGLRIGDPLATGRRLYGHAFQISAAQGGSWQLHTRQGTLAGYTYDVSGQGVMSPSNLVASIAAGDVGCPAMSP